MADTRSGNPGDLRMMSLLCAICIGIILWSLARYSPPWPDAVILVATK